MLFLCVRATQYSLRRRFNPKPPDDRNRPVRMFATVRRLTLLEWSPYMEETGANFNEHGPLQMTNPDPDGVAPMTNLMDRSFKEHNMAATWNGSMSANPVDRAQVIHLSIVSRSNQHVGMSFE